MLWHRYVLCLVYELGFIDFFSGWFSVEFTSVPSLVGGQIRPLLRLLPYQVSWAHRGGAPAAQWSYQAAVWHELPLCPVQVQGCRRREGGGRENKPGSKPGSRSATSSRSQSKKAGYIWTVQVTFLQIHQSCLLRVSAQWTLRKDLHYQLPWLSMHSHSLFGISWSPFIAWKRIPNILWRCRRKSRSIQVSCVNHLIEISWIYVLEKRAQWKLLMFWSLQLMSSCSIIF